MENGTIGIASFAIGVKMRLSPNFTLEELCATSTGAANVPNEVQTKTLLYLVTYILQPIRNKFGPLIISSGFRSELVNKKIKGSKISQHMQGEAVDIVPKDIDAVFEWCRKNIAFGQLINESKNGKRWLHISLPRIGGVNQQVLTFDGVKYAAV